MIESGDGAVASSAIEAEAAAFFAALQSRIVLALEGLDGEGRFGDERWERAGGGGGRTRVLEGGRHFERAGVSTSTVHGRLSEDFARSLPGDGLDFFATGISLIFHPQSPRVPAVHANFRCLRRGASRWFGGGTDLTPYYPVIDDVQHFHRTLKAACDRHAPGHYARFKRWCDEYFALPHRDGETRGVGGLFFDRLGDPPETDDPERSFSFVRDLAEAFLPAYLPIAERRIADPWGERERHFQLVRRGRYVEFNLLWDRGTSFGLRTGGRTESILVSMPPLVRWEHDATWADGSEEARLARWLRPRDWLADGAPPDGETEAGNERGAGGAG